MLKIRMQRTGRINVPSYRIVVVEHARSTKSGKIVERVGSYDPKTKTRKIMADRVKYWISVGAKPSDTMHNMLVSEGVISGKKINVLPKFKAPEAEPVAEAAPAEAPAAEVVAEAAPETPAETPAESVAESTAEEAKTE